MQPSLVALAAAGIVGGLFALGRGLAAYRLGADVGDTSQSRIASAAVGEILVTGVAEPSELTLVSPLQSAICLYYRSRIETVGDGDASEAFREERAVGFNVRDETGSLRVFPRGARFDVPDRFTAETGPFGDEPVGVRLRDGSAFGPGGDREAQIAALLTVHPAAESDGRRGFRAWLTDDDRRRSRRYREATIEPGDVVTVLGQALPFGQLEDPLEADSFVDGSASVGDPEVAADVRTARAAGILEEDPDDAWGNAAIPGFGIGQPVRAPELDPAAHHAPVADRETATRFEQTFRIDPEALVAVADRGVPLVVALGSPTVAAGRQRDALARGLLGAVVAIASATALALMLAADA